VLIIPDADWLADDDGFIDLVRTDVLDRCVELPVDAPELTPMDPIPEALVAIDVTSASAAFVSASWVLMSASSCINF
jgi:hypothetical protein